LPCKQKYCYFDTFLLFCVFKQHTHTMLMMYLTGRPVAQVCPQNGGIGDEKVRV